MRRAQTRLPRLMTAVALAAVVFAAGSPLAQASDPRSREASTSARAASSESVAQKADCILIDTDFDIDDIMAIPQLLATGRVVGIITTEGVALAPESASAAMKLYGQPGVTKHVPVVIGSTYPGAKDLSAYPWLPPLRASMATANDLFVTPMIPDPRTPASAAGLPSVVAGMVRGCPSVTMLVIGPFTSFQKYSPSIRNKISRVVMQGKPLRGDPTQPAGNMSFNCEYDLAACTVAFAQLRGLHPAWVDVPRNVTPAYVPTFAMVEGLRTTGLPGSTRDALLANPSTWEPTAITNGNKILLWDQSATTYILHPALFARVGAHWETTVTPEVFRRLWTESINRWTPLMPTP